MLHRTRNLTIGAFSLFQIATIMFVDVQMQTASAEVLVSTPQPAPLPMAAMGVAVPIFDFALPEETATSSAETTSEPVPHAASSQIQTPVHTYARASSNPGKPLRLVIPSIGLDADIQHLGKNAKGEMDVPSGDTDLVGWYKPGTVPGKIGSAVIAAHVFAAFSELKDLAVGSDIYVITEKNERLHFVVEDAREYALKDVSPHYLFNRRDARRLNLITCAGEFIPSMDTYTRRLIVSAKLVG